MTRATGDHLRYHTWVPYWAAGLDQDTLISALCRPTSDTLSEADPKVEPTSLGDLADTSGAEGFAAFERDEVAVVILAGGTGSRLGQLKYDVRIPGMGIQAMALRTAMSRVAGLGRIFEPPIWYLVPESRSGGVVDSGVAMSGFEIDERLRVLVQDEWIETDVMFDPMGACPMGTGNLVRRLWQDEGFNNWVDAGGRYVYVLAVDNVFANPDAAMLGDHILSGADASWETVTRDPSDASEHALVWNAGRQVAVRPNRLPDGFDHEALTHTVTNTAIINVAALQRHRKHRFRLERMQALRPGGIRLHLEQDLQELTEVMDCRFIKVPRELRFLPLRTPDDMARIEASLEGHQIIPDGMMEGNQ